MSQYSESQILEHEERLRQAMLTSDVAELDKLIAPELLFTTHLGHLISKEQDLALHQSGALKLTALTPSDQQIQLHEGCAIVSVLMHLEGSYNGAFIDEHIRYTRVWASASTGSLHVIAGHASALFKQ